MKEIYSFLILLTILLSSCITKTESLKTVKKQDLEGKFSNILPSKPILVYPPNEKSFIPHYTILRWNKSNDPNKDQIYYKIYFSKNADNLELISPKKYKDTTYNISQQIIEPQTTYYWKVDVFDFSNTMVSSDVFNFKSKADYIELIPIEGGELTLGDSILNTARDSHAHLVKLKNFYISKYEINNSQYCDFLNNIIAKTDGSLNGLLYIDINTTDNRVCGIEYRDNSFRPKDEFENKPVTHVTWYGANEFCSWAGGHLPTEAQWEYAARDGQVGIMEKLSYAGSNNADSVGWNRNNSEFTLQKTGIKIPNKLGLFDMSGNVNEWCSDWYSSGYYRDMKSPESPQGPTVGSHKVIRGGSFLNNQAQTSVIIRNSKCPLDISDDLGFRLVKEEVGTVE